MKLNTFGLMMLMFLAILSISVTAEPYVAHKYLNTSYQTDISTIGANDCDCSRIVANQTTNISIISYKLNTNGNTAVYRGFLFDGDTAKPINNLKNSSGDVTIDSVGTNYKITNWTLTSPYQVNNSNNYWICIEQISGSTAFESTGITGNPTGDDSWNVNAVGCLAGTWGSASRLQYSAGVAWYGVNSTPVTPESFNTSLVLKGRSELYNTYSGNISQFQEFFIGTNYSNNTGNFKSGAICNFTAYNISAHFGKISNNLSLSATQFLNMSIAEGTTNLLYDTIFFRTCRETVQAANIEIMLNGNSYYNITNAMIPLCSLGFYDFLNNTNTMNAQSNVNITLRCSACNPSAIWRIIQDNTSDILTYYRKFSAHTESLVENATSKFYEYNTYPYSYVSFGTKIFNVSLNCNNTNSTTTFDVSDSFLTVNITSINDLNFFSGINFEDTQFFNITSFTTGDFVTFFQMNVSYNNGTLIRSVTTNFISLNNSEINKDGIYNVSVVAYDDFNNKFYSRKYFVVNDTTVPSITFYEPSETNTTEFLNGNNRITVIANDLNLFGLEYRIYDPLGTLIYNESFTNLNVTNYNFSKIFLFNYTGLWKLEVNATDDHTAEEISNYKYSTSDDRLIEFEFEKLVEREKISDNVTIQYIGKYAITDIEVQKETDRYTFNYDISYESDIALKEVENKFRIKCDGLTFRPFSNYTAHFVCWNAKQWIDFENPQIINWHVDKISDDEYEIILLMKPDKDMKFSSIGGINNNFKEAYFTVSAEIVEPVSLFSFDYSQTSHVLLLLVLVILYLGCNLLGMFFGNYGFIALGFFFGIIIGIILFTLSIVFPIAIIMISLGIFLMMIKQMQS